MLRGERVTWDRDRDRKPHLGGDAAERLLREALGLYARHFGDPPKRVVLHKTSRYWPDELAGFRAGLGSIHAHDFLAVERRGVRFLRPGHEPPVRGTMVELGGGTTWCTPRGTSRSSGATRGRGSRTRWRWWSTTGTRRPTWCARRSWP